MRWVLAAVLLAVGCAGDKAAPEQPEVALARLAGLIDALCSYQADAWCAAAQRCGCNDIPGFPAAAAACREHALEGCRADWQRLRTMVSAGSLEVADDLMPGCAVAIDAAVADCRLPEPDLFAVACPIVRPVGLRAWPAVGEACDDALCSDGTRCASDGVCRVPAAGQTCAARVDCVAGEECSEAAGERQCRPWDHRDAGKVCAGPMACGGDTLCLAARGLVCRARVDGGACGTDADCVDGQFCSDGLCAAAPGLGEDCGGGAACAAGTACVVAPGPNQGTCQVWPRDGEPCALGVDGPFVCAAGLACKDRFCGPIPAQGERCAVGSVRCAEGLGCFVREADTWCDVRVGAGEACGLDDSCAEGLFCNFTDGVCEAVRGAGSPCEGGNECGREGACVPDAAGQFRCVPRPAREGDACFLDNSCAPAFVCRSPFDAGRCAPAMCAEWPF